MNRKLRRAQAKAGTSNSSVSGRDTDGIFLVALGHHQSGRLAEAEAQYRRILAMEPRHADSLHLLGVLAHQAGQNESAIRLITQAIDVKDTHPGFHSNLAVALSALDRHAEALAACDRALALDPDYAEAHSNRGNALKGLGRAEDAVSAYAAALRLKPGYAEAHLNRGLALHDLGRLDDAVAAFDAAIRIRPDHVGAHYNRGVALQDLGRYREAIAAYDVAIRFKPEHVESLGNRGTALQKLGRLNDALAAFAALLALRPTDAEALSNQGAVLSELGQLAEAVDTLQAALAIDPTLVEAQSNLSAVLLKQDRSEAALAAADCALRLQPDRAEAHFNRGNALQSLGRDDEALAAFDAALALKPDYGEAHLNRGAVLKGRGLLDEAVAAFQASCRYRPQVVDGYSNLGVVLNDLGRRREAEACFRRALDLKPDHAVAHRNLLATLLYGDDLSPEQRFAAHRGFETACRPRDISSRAVFSNSRDPKRRLKIGFVSSDLREHPVGRNLLPLLEAHDRTRLGLNFYAHVEKPDAMTARFRAVADSWRSIVTLTDAEVATAILDDGIDVLVHLAGRFDFNRPLIAAHRPAPVQVSFHDPATSGIVDMDAIIADRVLVPRRPTERFTERPIRLPSFYLHAPMGDAPPVVPPPILTNGYATFGSFNNPAKLSDETLAAWALVLKTVPGARLMLKYKNWFHTPSVAERVLGIMAAHGIDPSRINLGEGREEEAVSHLARYGAIDVALDPFPFNGSTTTFESLWMGVPVVTLLGTAMVGRWTASILSALGLGALVARTAEDYAELCRALCAEPENLARLRADLRQRVARSPICDAGLKARHLERAYGALWRRWCAVPP